MNKCFSIALLVSVLHVPAYALTENTPIALEARIITSIDGVRGIGIDGTTIDIMKAFQSGMEKILSIKVPYGDEKISLQELIQLEQELEQNRAQLSEPEYNTRKEQLRSAVAKAKELFLKLSNQFKSIVQDVKPIMATLIKESSSKRNRMDSLLVIWADTKQENEEALFDQYVRTVGEFATFCTDLYTFLGDLMHSCPKARAQYQAIKNKVDRVQSVIDELEMITDKKTCRNFLLYVKKHHLDKLKLDEITQTKVRQLFDGFIKRKK